MRKHSSFISAFVRLTVAALLVVACATAARAAQRAGGASAARPGADSPAQQQVIAATTAWANAVEANDLEQIGRMLAEDFTTIQFTGQGVVMLDKTQELAMLKQPAAARAKIHRVLDRADVRIHGNVAILTAAATYTGSNPSGGGTSKTQALITEIWLNEGGTWRLTHFQPSPGLRAASANP